MKYRIKQITKKWGNGQTKIYYKIQKKNLFGWFDVSEKCVSGIYSGQVKTTRCVYQYSSLEKAQQALENIKNPFKEKYKGYTIKAIHLYYYPYKLYYVGHCFLYHEENIEILKQRIDSNQLEVSEKVTYNE